MRISRARANTARAYDNENRKAVCSGMASAPFCISLLAYGSRRAGVEVYLRGPTGGRGPFSWYI